MSREGEKHFKEEKKWGFWILSKRREKVTSGRVQIKAEKTLVKEYSNSSEIDEKIPPQEFGADLWNVPK